MLAGLGALGVYELPPSSSSSSFPILALIPGI